MDKNSIMNVLNVQQIIMLVIKFVLKELYMRIATLMLLMKIYALNVKQDTH